MGWLGEVAEDPGVSLVPSPGTLDGFNSGTTNLEEGVNVNPQLCTCEQPSHRHLH